MPTEFRPSLRRSLGAAILAALASPAWAQTDEAVPFYAGASLGVTHVSNLYRLSTATNSDTVVSAGLLAGLDRRLGRQHLTLGGSLQDNRYVSTQSLNNQSYALHGALDWQTVANLSGTLGFTNNRALADFNIGGIAPILKKNIERDDEYQAVARLGADARYSLEAGWAYRRREFSAEEYDRFVFHQSTGHLGVYAQPAGNLRLGLVGRHTQGQFPRYPIYLFGFPVGVAPNDFTRNDMDLTARWNTGGSSTLNARFSHSRTSNSLESVRNFSGNTGGLGWNWQVDAKLQLNLQYGHDTGQESQARAADVNRVYSAWQLGGSYALTSKVSLNANTSISRSRSRPAGDAGAGLSESFDTDKTYSLGLRWGISRALSLACQYNYNSRDSSTPLYIYNADSFGCTGQALIF